MTALTAPVQAMLTAAKAAMRDLRTDLIAASGCSDMEGLGIHRKRTEAMFDAGGAVDRFNVQAALVGAEPVTMMSSIWPNVHADAVAQMVASATAAALEDGAVALAA